MFCPLQRMHLALLRQAYRAMKDQEGAAGEGTGDATAALSAVPQPSSLAVQVLNARGR